MTSTWSRITARPGNKKSIPLHPLFNVDVKGRRKLTLACTFNIEEGVKGNLDHFDFNFHLLSHRYNFHGCNAFLVSVFLHELAFIWPALCTRLSWAPVAHNLLLDKTLSLSNAQKSSSSMHPCRARVVVVDGYIFISAFLSGSCCGVHGYIFISESLPSMLKYRKFS